MYLERRGAFGYGANYDFVIVGAGIVVLARAIWMSLNYPDFRILVLEKELTIAAHQSSHNSRGFITGFISAVAV